MKNVHFGYILNEVDMIAFGLVLNVSNITELDGNSSIDPKEKTINIGVSVLLIIVFACFLAMSYIADIPGMEGFDKGNIRNLSIGLSVVAFFFSYSIFKKLT